MVQTRRNSFSVPSLPPLGRAANSNAKKKTNAKGTAAVVSLVPRHFLRDVNLDHCSDMLSIPDPPSPPALPQTKRNNPRRRQSSPMLRPLFRDVTNEELLLSSSPRKRSRKSLCHVPSPSINDESDGESLNEATKSSSAVEEIVVGSEENVLKFDTSMGSIICFDDDDDDDDDDDGMAVSSSKRQKRRETMALLPKTLTPLHQEDYSGEEEPLEGRGAQTKEETQTFADTPTYNVAAFELKDQNDDDDNALTLTRPSERQSMVLPSDDVVSFQNEVANQVFGLEATKTVDLSPEEMDLTDDDDDVWTPRQRPTKRQSMVLPSDVALLEGFETTHEYFQDYQNDTLIGVVPKENSVMYQKMPAKHSPTQAESRVQDIEMLEAAVVATPVLSAKEARAGPLDGNKTELIRSLVREYCALPISGRQSSKQAEEIERLTSYSLIPPAARQRKETRNNGVDLNWSGSPTTGYLMPKRELMLTLGALMELIEERKVLDTKKMEAQTQCRVHRSRSGKFRYFHIFTNGKVSPATYEQRYLAALERSKAESQKHIQDWIKRIEGRPCQPLWTGDDTKVMNLKNNDSTVIDCEPYRGIQENDEHNTKTLPPTKDVAEHSPHSFGSVDIIVTDSSLEPSASTLDKDKDDPLSAVVEKVGGYAQGNDTDSRMELVDASSSSPTDSLLQETELQGDDDDLTDLLLPLPSRDEASTDPAIAAAEATLWAAIDSALETYSRQVIAIRKTRMGSL